MAVTRANPMAHGGARADADARFMQLAATEWQWRLAQFPQLATRVGEHRHDDHLEHVDAASRRERLTYWRRVRAALEQMPPGELGPRCRVDRAVFAHQIDGLVADAELQAERIPLNCHGNFYSPLGELPSHQPLANGADYRRYLARLADIPRYFEEHIELMREGLRTGWTLPRCVLEGQDEPLARMAALTDPTQTPFFTPFRIFPPSAPQTEQVTLRAQATQVIGQAVLPAYAALLRFLRDEYRPGARTSTGALDLPSGARFYEAQVRKFTSLSLTPEALHARGLDEVARIGEAMREVIAGTGFDQGFAAFVQMLHTEPRFHARTPQDLLAQACRIAKRIDGVLPRFFGRLPRQPFGVAPVPDDIAPYYAPACYRPPPQPLGFAGTLWLNTHALESRPLYTLPAVTLHEGVPGHHLQIAIAREDESHPDYRRFGQVPAYGEGWALYAESLGEEMGIYLDPYERFGRLVCEMWRACRLVIDTGLHAFGWSRDEARAYLLANAGLTEHEAGTDVDRCISWPGHALAFKTGELKLRELRERARRALGRHFVLSEFHDALLAPGPVPLPVLDDLVTDWIERRLAG